MLHTASLVASLASLGLICAIYYCNLMSHPKSWLRSEMLAMVLLSLLVGIFPMALFGAPIALWQALTGGAVLERILSAGVDLVSIGAVLATLVVFRALVKGTYRTGRGPGNVTTLSPGRPAADRTHRFRKAA